MPFLKMGMDKGKGYGSAKKKAAKKKAAAIKSAKPKKK